MIQCPRCKYENNDGSQYCLNCRLSLPRTTALSDYQKTMRTYQAQEAEKSEQTKRSMRIVLAVIAIMVLIIVILLVRVGEADTRAETLVKDYLSQRFTNITSIECTCYSIGYDEFQGYKVSAKLQLTNGDVVYALAVVNMDSFLSEGELASLQIEGQYYSVK